MTTQISSQDLAKILVRLPKYSKLIYSLYNEPEVPKIKKIYLGASLAYIASPIDLVPGIIPVLGQLDDLYIILSAAEKALLSCSRETAQKHLEENSLTIEELEKDLILIKTALKQWGMKALKITGKLASGSIKLAGNLAIKGYRKFKTRGVRN